MLSPPIAAGPSISGTSDDLDPSDDESELQKNVIEGFNKLSIDPLTYRYHGKSSGLVFVRAAKHLKDQIEADTSAPTKEGPHEEPPRLSKQHTPTPVSGFKCRCFNVLNHVAVVAEHSRGCSGPIHWIPAR